MLTQLNLTRLTVFSDCQFHFGKRLNIFVGENGSGKTHILKAAYTVCAVSREAGRKGDTLTKYHLQSGLADKLLSVFRPDSLGRLTQRKQGRERCDIRSSFDDTELDMAFSFATNSKSEVNIDTMPTKALDVSPAFFPTRELLTLYPNFISIYEGHYLEFEETWRDLCILLGQPMQRGPKEAKAKALLAPLEKVMGGQVVLDKTGRFYLNMPQQGQIEMPLVAEGIRKFAMVARLVSTGALLGKGYLFWDEPEANLNPLLIKQIAQTIVDISRAGIQLFIATHSLFLLRELEILINKSAFKQGEVRYFGLHNDIPTGAVVVDQGDDIDSIGDIAALNEELGQSDRYMEAQDAYH